MPTTLGHTAPLILESSRLEFGNVDQIKALHQLGQPQEPNEEGQKLYRVLLSVSGCIEKEVWAEDEEEAGDKAYEEAQSEVEIDDAEIQVDRVKEVLL